jgi:hypothetical protein
MFKRQSEFVDLLQNLTVLISATIPNGVVQDAAGTVGARVARYFYGALCWQDIRFNNFMQSVALHFLPCHADIFKRDFHWRSVSVWRSQICCNALDARLYNNKIFTLLIYLSKTQVAHVRRILRASSISI